MYGTVGFIIGFFVGMGINAYLLKNVDRQALRLNKNLRIIYGLLNWGVAAIGAVIGVALQNAGY